MKRFFGKSTTHNMPKEVTIKRFLGKNRRGMKQKELEDYKLIQNGQEQHIDISQVIAP